MEFNDNGTVSVDIGGQTYSLKRPTMKQLWEFFDLREELSERAQGHIRELSAQLAEADDDSPEAEGLVEELRDRQFAFRFMSEPWLREAFEELGSKPLPENLDDAPSELADPSLPTQILLHWREVPLAHSRRRT